MNNLLSYYGLTDSRMSASEKDLPVSVNYYLKELTGKKKFFSQIDKSTGNKSANALLLFWEKIHSHFHLLHTAHYIHLIFKWIFTTIYYQWFSEPFAKELAEGEDERLAKHIEERIYQHLMRQTEIGVASEEALDGVVEESDEGKQMNCG